MLNVIYKIYKIRDRETGEVHEREIRRQGHRLKILSLDIGMPLVWEYLDGSGVMRTSRVELFSIKTDVNDSLIVTTQNTIYTFKKCNE